jgi:hypothetical protein
MDKYICIIYIYIYIYVHIYIYVYIYVCIYICVYIYTYITKYTLIEEEAYTSKHAYMHLQAFSLSLRAICFRVVIACHFLVNVRMYVSACASWHWFISA